jgi:hypothetical protein
MCKILNIIGVFRIEKFSTLVNRTILKKGRSQKPLKKRGGTEKPYE